LCRLHRGKSFAELEELEAEIEHQLGGPEAGETEYWGAVLKRIVVHKVGAAAQVRESS
jgi:hypothetical protein